MRSQLHSIENRTPVRDELYIFRESQFLHVLKQERARSDRNEQPFSLAIFKIHSLQNNITSVDEFIKLVVRRIRLTDHAGWFDRRTFGIILPETPAEGAWKVVREIRDRFRAQASNIEYTVYTYPRQSLPHLDGHGAQDDKIFPAQNGQRGKMEVGNSPPVQSHSFEDGQTVQTKAIEQDMLRSGQPSKRLFDVVVASLLLLLLSPLFLLIAIAIKCVSTGPAIFSQVRLGHLGQPFRFYKFRTMEYGASTVMHSRHLDQLMTKDTPMTKLDAKDDMRVFSLGKILRQTCLDELPQLFNVLRGEMSLVGPRPCLPYEALNYARWQHRRFDCLPGMTGLWQVSGKNRTTFKEMIRMDISYASKWSLMLDLKILFRTVPFVLNQLKLALNPRQNAKR